MRCVNSKTDDFMCPTIVTCPTFASPILYTGNAKETRRPRLAAVFQPLKGPAWELGGLGLSVIRRRCRRFCRAEAAAAGRGWRHAFELCFEPPRNWWGTRRWASSAAGWGGIRTGPPGSGHCDRHFGSTSGSASNLYAFRNGPHQLLIYRVVPQKQEVGNCKNFQI